MTHEHADGPETHPGWAARFAPAPVIHVFGRSKKLRPELKSPADAVSYAWGDLFVLLAADGRLPADCLVFVIEEDYRQHELEAFCVEKAQRWAEQHTVEEKERRLNRMEFLQPEPEFSDLVTIASRWHQTTERFGPVWTSWWNRAADRPHCADLEAGPNCNSNMLIITPPWAREMLVYWDQKKKDCVWQRRFQNSQKAYSGHFDVYLWALFSTIADDEELARKWPTTAAAGFLSPSNGHFIRHMSGTQVEGRGMVDRLSHWDMRVTCQNLRVYQQLNMKDKESPTGMPGVFVKSFAYWGCQDENDKEAVWLGKEHLANRRERLPAEDPFMEMESGRVHEKLMPNLDTCEHMWKTAVRYDQLKAHKHLWKNKVLEEDKTLEDLCWELAPAEDRSRLWSQKTPSSWDDEEESSEEETPSSSAKGKGKNQGKRRRRDRDATGRIARKQNGWDQWRHWVEAPLFVIVFRCRSAEVDEVLVFFAGSVIVFHHHVVYILHEPLCRIQTAPCMCGSPPSGPSWEQRRFWRCATPKRFREASWRCMLPTGGSGVRCCTRIKLMDEELSRESTTLSA